MRALEIFIGILGMFTGVVDIIYWCPGDILLVSWRYFIGFLELFDGCAGDI